MTHFYVESKQDKKNYKRLLKQIGNDFLLLSPEKRLLMVKTAGIIKLPWIGRFYKKDDFGL